MWDSFPQALGVLLSPWSQTQNAKGDCLLQPSESFMIGIWFLEVSFDCYKALVLGGIISHCTHFFFLLSGIKISSGLQAC